MDTSGSLHVMAKRWDVAEGVRDTCPVATTAMDVRDKAHRRSGPPGGHTAVDDVSPVSLLLLACRDSIVETVVSETIDLQESLINTPTLM